MPEPFVKERHAPKLAGGPTALTEDPRTGLPLIDVPADLGGERGPFRDFEGSVLHFFEHVKKFWKKGRQVAENRILCITDMDLFQCAHDGLINRCCYVDDVEEILMDNTKAVGLKMTLTKAVGQREYDMLYQLSSLEQQELVVHIITELQKFHGVTVARVIHQEHPIDANQLRLTKPDGWQFELHSVRTKEKLYEELLNRERERHMQHQRQLDAGSAASADTAAVPPLPADGDGLVVALAEAVMRARPADPRSFLLGRVAHP